MVLPPLPYPHLHNRVVKSSGVPKSKVAAAVGKFFNQNVFLPLKSFMGTMSSFVTTLDSALESAFMGKPILVVAAIVVIVANILITILKIPFALVGLFLQFLVLVTNELA